MNLLEIAKRFGGDYELVKIPSLDLEVRIRKLKVKEQEEVQKLMTSCSVNGELVSLTRLAYQLVKRFITDADGNSLVENISEEQFGQQPVEMISALTSAYAKVNNKAETLDPN
jgi:hypothetical protein